jgi:hypothetical protein
MFFSYFRVVPSFPNPLARPGSLVQRAFWIVSKVRGEPPFPASPMYASAANLRSGAVAIPRDPTRRDPHSPVRAHASGVTGTPCPTLRRADGRAVPPKTTGQEVDCPQAGGLSPRQGACGQQEAMRGGRALRGGRRSRATVRRAAQRQGSAAWRCCRAPARPSGREPWPHVVLGGRV